MNPEYEVKKLDYHPKEREKQFLKEDVEQREIILRAFFLRFKRFELFWTIEKEKKKTHNNEGELENKERGRDDNILREKCGNGS